MVVMVAGFQFLLNLSNLLKGIFRFNDVEINGFNVLLQIVVAAVDGMANVGIRYVE